MNIFSKEWGHDEVCLRKSQGHVNMKAVLCNASLIRACQNG